MTSGKIGKKQKKLKKYQGCISSLKAVYKIPKKTMTKRPILINFIFLDKAINGNVKYFIPPEKRRNKIDNIFLFLKRKYMPINANERPIRSLWEETKPSIIING